MALPRKFFVRSSPLVAADLLGCWLVRAIGDRENRVRITETEAYLGASDPASHAFRGQTPRNAPMFGKAGIAYVYFIYGMHYCFNVVTGREGDPQAVLLRGAMDAKEGASRLKGPALLCRALGIDLALNGADLCGSGERSIWFEAGDRTSVSTQATPRVGVRDLTPMRFVDAASRLPLSIYQKSEPRRARSINMPVLQHQSRRISRDKKSAGDVPLTRDRA